MSAEDALISSYKGAVLKAEAAARARLSVAVSPGRVAHAMRSLKGLDTAHLRKQAAIAAGTSQPAGVQRSIISVVWPLIQNIVGGIAGSALVEWASSLFSQKDKADQVAEDTCQAADAIDRINLDFSAGSAAILENLTASIDALAAFLESVSPQENPQECAAAVTAMQDLIDAAGRSLLDNCSNRDEAVGQCFDELIERGKSATCVPAPDYAPGACDGAEGVVSGAAEKSIQLSAGGTVPATSGSAVPAPSVATSPAPPDVAAPTVPPATTPAPPDVAAPTVPPATTASAASLDTTIPAASLDTTIPAASGSAVPLLSEVTSPAAGGAVQAECQGSASLTVDGAGNCEVKQHLEELGHQIGQAAGEFVGSVAHNLTVAGSAMVEGFCEAAVDVQAECEFSALAQASLEGSSEVTAHELVANESSAHEPSVPAGLPGHEPLVPADLSESTSDPDQCVSLSPESEQEVSDTAHSQKCEEIAEVPLDQRPEPVPPAEKLAHQPAEVPPAQVPPAQVPPPEEAPAPPQQESTCTPRDNDGAEDVAGQGLVTAHAELAGEAHVAGGVRVPKVGQWR